jgi:AcrR family transcriptional regulator
VDEHTRAADTGGQAGRRTRWDAERNRQALLDTARELYAADGIDVPLEAIARTAGVGIGTLYRHFPRGKEQLVAEALVHQAGRYLDAARRALEVVDPWAGFTGFVTDICALQEDHLGLADLLAMALPDDERVEEIRQEAYDACIELIERAKATGRLRPDVVGEDILLVLMANAAVVGITRQVAPRASRRIVGLLLQAMASTSAAAALPAPPSSDEMRRAMVRLAGSRGCARSQPLTADAVQVRN